MISSTFTDLEEHRSALIKAIKGQGFTDIAMENDSARVGLDLIDSSLHMVRDSSAYVGIISHKYGQIPRCPQRNPKNLSITELEFAEAQRLGRPILLFIMGDKHPVIKADVETNATKRRKLKAFKDRAKKMKPDSEVHRVYATFESLEEFTQKSQQAIANLRRYLDDQVSSIRQHAREFITTSVVAERKVFPSSLPSQPYFFGREKELRIIAEAIAPEARTWGALIDGPGGIGKTALAIRAAHVAPESDFDCKIFLSAKVRELTPHGEQPLEDFMLPNYMALLTELARELGHDNIERIDPNERPNAVRRALAAVRPLIVIDNVETFPESERVRLYHFLSRLPASCKAIVTSRRRVDIDARVVQLDRLARNDALTLLAELAKNNRHLQKAAEHEHRELYEVTNGNPLLLKWAVGQLGRTDSQCRTVPEICEFLKAATTENDPLEYIFGDLLETFTDSEIAVLSALVHFKDSATVMCISNVTGLAQKSALTALEDLSDRALLVSNEEGDSFFMPPLVAKYLRRKHTKLINEMGDNLMERVDLLARENGYENYDRFPTLEGEWPMIAAALPLFEFGENGRLQQICFALNSFLHFSGRWDDRLILNQQAEKKASLEGDLYNAGARAYHSGYIYFVRKQGSEVLACAARGMQYWKHLGPPELAVFIHLRGQGYFLMKNYSAAMEAFEEALNLKMVVDPESQNVAVTLCSVAEVKREQGDLVGAERVFQEALQIVQKNNHLPDAVYLKCNLAETALDSGAWKSAEARAREVLGLAEKFVGQELIGVSSSVLAKALVKQGKGAEGMPYALRAVEIFGQLRMPEELEQAKAVLEECKSGSQLAS